VAGGVAQWQPNFIYIVCVGGFDQIKRQPVCLTHPQRHPHRDSGTHTDAEALALQFEDKQLKCISCCLSVSVSVSVSVGGAALYMAYVYICI